MPIFTALQLRRVACDIFIAAGAAAEEARIVSDALVEANLVGHDSHGVLRIPEYVRSMEQGLVNTSAQIRIVRETPAVAVVDGGWGFGQVIARKTMEIAIEKASRLGVGAVSVFQSCHVGRVGDYPLIAAERGMAAIMFVNTHGGGKLVAPWGGSERRLSANPISVAIPRSSGPPILVDISTSAIAEGTCSTARCKSLRGALSTPRVIPQLTQRIFTAHLPELCFRSGGTKALLSGWSPTSLQEQSRAPAAAVPQPSELVTASWWSSSMCGSSGMRPNSKLMSSN